MGGFTMAFRGSSKVSYEWGPTEKTITLGIVTWLLSLADAFSTILLLEQGFYEANPFMRYLLDEHSTTIFVIVKQVMVGGGLLTLYYGAPRFRYFWNKVFFWGYTIVLVWHAICWTTV